MICTIVNGVRYTDGTIIVNINSLCSYLNPSYIISPPDMDNAVDLFTNKLNDIMSPYCRQNGVQSRDSLFTSALNGTSPRGRHLNKPWFDKDVKKSYYVSNDIQHVGVGCEDF